MKTLLYSLLLLLFLSSCGKMKEPEFRKLENFGVKKLGFNETIIGFNATYFNPNNFGVTVKEAVFDVYVDSVYIGKFNQPGQVVVNKNADFSIPMQGAVSLDKALSLNIPNLIGKEVLLSANGSVRVGKGGVFITKDLKYQGKHRLDRDLLKNPAGAGLFN